MIISGVFSNPFETLFFAKQTETQLVHGNAQSFSTNICQMTLHRLPKGAALPKQVHHLARWILVVRGAVQLSTGTNQTEKWLINKQSVMLHSYTNCQMKNMHSEEAWVFEFAFMTIDPIAAPAVRSMNAIEQNGTGEARKQFCLPDWTVEWTELAPEQFLVGHSNDSAGHYLMLDTDDHAQVEFLKAEQVCSIDGGKNGKHVFYIKENMELWN